MIETINANCLDVLKETAANSQDLIFCDPPYALGSDVIIRKDGKPDYRKAVDFMAKWQQPDGYFWEQWFAEAFRVLRYGGRVVMFGMDRQLMLNKYYACFAGFAEQQSLYWFAISGFPKASDLGKMLDKNAGAEREVVGKYKRPDGTERPNRESWQLKGNWKENSGFDPSKDAITTPATTLAQKYDGMKYSIAPLKQTNETILVFQKPYKTGSCLHDTLAYENGDAECMCGAVDVEGNRCEANGVQLGRNNKRDAKMTNTIIDLGLKAGAINFDATGRYPAQTYCDDEAAKVLDRQSGVQKGSDSIRNNKNSVTTGKDSNTSCYGKYNDCTTKGHADTGGCSRILHRCNYDLNDYDIYMYCPKVSNKERNEGCGMLETHTSNWNAKSTFQNTPPEKQQPKSNNHPTVKPIALLKKIIQLFKTPNPLHVLDPFMGSGSMGIACIELGVSYTGVELDPEYYTIAQTRLAHHNTKNNSKLF